MQILVQHGKNLSLNEKRAGMLDDTSIFSKPGAH
jgi:hypothetical protein